MNSDYNNHRGYLTVENYYDDYYKVGFHSKDKDDYSFCSRRAAKALAAAYMSEWTTMPSSPPPKKEPDWDAPIHEQKAYQEIR